MKICVLRAGVLKGIVITLPLGWWSPFDIPYTNVTLLLIYAYLAVSVLTFPDSFSLHRFRKYALPLFVLWVIMLLTTNIYTNEDAESANSILRQFLFYSVFFAFAVRDVALMAARGESLILHFSISLVGLVLAFFGGFATELASTGRQALEGMNANVVAMYCVCGFLVLLDSVFKKRKGKPRYWIRGWSLLGLASLTMIIAQTGSRTGVLILGAGLTVYFVTWSRITLRRLALIFPALLIGMFAFWSIASSDIISDRIRDLDDDIRLTLLWPAALEVVKEYPLFGVGLGRIESVIIESAGMLISLHNEYLKIATSSGLVGLVLFSLVMLRLLGNSARVRRVTGSGLLLALWTIVTLYLVPGGGALEQPLIWVLFLIVSGPPVAGVASRSLINRGQETLGVKRAN